MIVKICGMTRIADALHAAQQGATGMGFVFWPGSPRYIRPARAADIVRELPATVTTVGVFVNQTVEEIAAAASEAGVRAVQLHGDEPPAYAGALKWPIWRALSLAAANGELTAWPPGVTILLDAHDRVRRGGTGQPIDWARAAAVARQRRVVLAGGLTPDNVHHAIATVRPFGVDVSSGVEEAPGVKDPAKVTRFLERARAAFYDR